MIYQIGALQAFTVSAGSTVSYVKPHGALYNTVVTNEDQARAVGPFGGRCGVDDAHRGVMRFE